MKECGTCGYPTFRSEHAEWCEYVQRFNMDRLPIEYTSSVVRAAGWRPDAKH